jgi:hypothetical protein
MSNVRLWRIGATIRQTRVFAERATKARRLRRATWRLFVDHTGHERHGSGVLPAMSGLGRGNPRPEEVRAPSQLMSSLGARHSSGASWSSGPRVPVLSETEGSR